MKTKTRHLCPLAASLLAACLLASCVYDRDSERVATPDGGRLVININSSPVGTRSTVINDGSSSTNTDAEKTVTTMAVGIYSSDGTTKKDFQYLENLSGTTEWSTVTEHAGLTQALAAGDQALVVINASQTVAQALRAATTASGFKAVASSIDQALLFADAYTAGGTIDPAKLPMYGSGELTAASDGTSGNFEVDVTVIHMVAKVTLNTITMSNVGATAQFTPTAIFLINVPEKLDFAFTTDGDESSYGFGGITTNFFQGESAAVAASTTVTDGSLTTRQYRDYLGTGALSVQAVTQDAPQETTYTFYTMPNGNSANDTRLVIAGQWSDDGGTTTTDVWYSIELMNVGDGGALTNNLYPNRHYKVDVDLQRAGAEKVDDDATGAYNTPGTQQAVKATVSIQAWNDGSMTTTFGGNGGDPDEQ